MRSIAVILAGAGLLVGGLLLMRLGLQRALWSRLRSILIKATVSPWLGAIWGMVAAALFQSSTAVCLITIGLVTAEYLTFRQGLGLILGANVGTCSTVQMLSVFSPEQLVMPLLLLAAFASLRRRTRPIGLAITGLSFMFCGLHCLNVGFSALQEMDELQRILQFADRSPYYGILGGLLLTFLFQSSSAATAMLMSLTEQGMLTLKAATYIVYGNNLGSCFSSLLIGAVAPIAARRVALAHVLLNMFGVLVFLPATNQLVLLSEWISSDFSVQVAAIHTIFNVISSLAVLPIAGLFSRLIELLTPETMH